MFTQKTRTVALGALTLGAILFAAESVTAQPIGYRVGRAVGLVSSRLAPDGVYYGDYAYPTWVYVPWYGYYPIYTYDAAAPVVPTPAFGNGYRAAYPVDRPVPQAATLSVRVPAEAEVWLQGMRTNQTGTERVFVSPPLLPGPEYTYEVRARWRQDGRDADWARRVRVRAGEQIKIDFLAPPTDQRPNAAEPKLGVDEAPSPVRAGEARPAPAGPK